jgi:hypothetical protein
VTFSFKKRMLPSNVHTTDVVLITVEAVTEVPATPAL